LSATEAIQVDCDVKETNIILQGLPPKVYALVSIIKSPRNFGKELQLLMQGTSLTKQERECKLYDEFDKFAYKKGETLCEFYLRFSLLLKDMNIYNMKLEQFQVNIKFLNTLPPLLSTTTLLPPSIPIISHVQQAPAPSPVNVPSLSLQDLPNFGSLFGFNHRLKALESNFLEFI
nr:hypothetical protein [Tanacetum cinerariifolium]